MMILNPLLGHGQEADSLIAEGRRLVNEELKFNEARVLFAEAAIIAQQQNDFEGIAKANYRIGRSFYYQDNYVLALRYFLVAEEAIDNNGGFVAEAPVFIAIGVIYDALESHQQAVDYHQRALDQAKAEDNAFYAAIIYNNLAESYYLANDFNRAIAEANNSYQMYDSLDYDMGKSEVLPKMGHIELARGDVKQAKVYFDQALSIIIRDKDHPRYGMGYMGLSQYYREINDLDKEYEYLLKAKHYTDSLKQLKTQFDIYQLLAQNAEARDDFESALGFTRVYEAMNDSLQKIQDQIITNETLAQFDSQQKEEDIQNLSQENERNAQRLKNQRNWIIVILIGIGLLIGISILVYQLYKRNRKARLSVEDKNEQISTLIKELHHRVKNNLQVVSGMLQLQASNSENTETKASLHEGQQRIKAMALIHEKLYQKENISKIDLGEYLEELTKSIHMLSLKPNQEVTLHFDFVELMLDIDMAVSIGLMCNEIVTNAFKHGFKDGRNGAISISSKHLENHQVELTIIDNGIGMEKPPSESSGELGLRLVRGLVWQVDGELLIEHEENSKFIIRFNPNFSKN